jgi:hypothetical protein
MVSDWSTIRNQFRGDPTEGGVGGKQAAAKQAASSAAIAARVPTACAGDALIKSGPEANHFLQHLQLGPAIRKQVLDGIGDPRL